MTTTAAPPTAMAAPPTLTEQPSQPHPPTAEHPVTHQSPRAPSASQPQQPVVPPPAASAMHTNQSTQENLQRDVTADTFTIHDVVSLPHSTMSYSGHSFLALFARLVELLEVSVERVTMILCTV